MQTTLRRSVECDGVGLHGGRAVRVRLSPAQAGRGIVFRRVDLRGAGRDLDVPARGDAVVDTTLCTRLANADGVSVGTVEHLMAALAGRGVDNVLIEIDGPEVPIMDGSARDFVEAIDAAGVAALDAAPRAIRILSPVVVEGDGKSAELHPADRFEIDYAIDFGEAAIGRQTLSRVVTPRVFAEELADCRTFCRLGEVEMLREMGLARGGGLHNAVVVDGARVLNPEGLRRRDEFVRHKMLDAVGDLALAGAPILGRYVGRRAGHEMTNRLLRRLFDRPDCWRWETAETAAPAPAEPLRAAVAAA